MAVIFMDGYDHYGTSANLLTNGEYADAHNLSLVANAGPGGVGTVVNLGDFSPGYLRKVLPGERAMIGVGGRWYFQALSAGIIYQFIDLFGVEIGRLEILSTGALQFLAPGGLGLLWRSDPVIVAQSWQFIEVAVDFSDAAGGGFLRVGVDSVTIYDNDAIQTQPVTVPAQNACSQVVWTFYGGRFRDTYIWDDTGDLNNSGMQGDRQIITSFATADALDDWVPSAGASGWPLVSNNPPNDAQFISANAPNLVSTFQMSDIDTDITNISAVRVVSRLWKSDAGLATVKLQVTSSGDTAQGAEKAVSTNKVFYGSIFEKDPHTGVKWSPAGVNAMTAGLERIS